MIGLLLNHELTPLRLLAIVAGLWISYTVRFHASDFDMLIRD